MDEIPDVPSFGNKPTQNLEFSSKLLVLVVSFCVVVIIAFIVSYAYYLGESNKPIILPEDKEEVSLTIEKGMTTSEVADYLKEQGLIGRPELLRVYMFLNTEKKIQAGYYLIPADNLTLSSLVDQLQKGSFEVKLTFIEGWRIEQYDQYLRDQVSDEYADRFMASDFIKEGYMFPDTYIIDRSYEPENLASTMRNTFKKRYSQDLIDTAEFKGMSMDEVVILASIVEREMNISSERPIVAGILYKRWKKGWALQADATLQYAKGNTQNWWPQAARSDYKELNSPYNSYMFKGLPPEPICNPGLKAIEAVVNFENNSYWFYLTDKNGVTHYAETLEEHNENVAKYL